LKTDRLGLKPTTKVAGIAAARKYIPAQLSQWGKVRRLEGGDTMHARDLVRFSERDRDASYVCVSFLIHPISYKPGSTCIAHIVHTAH
jgi:hypothetical protein